MANAALLDKIRIKLGQFKLGEFQDHVSPCLPKGRLDVIYTTLMSENIRVTKRNVNVRLCKSLQKENSSSLLKIYLQLCCVSISLHYYRRLWHAYLMKGDSRDWPNFEVKFHDKFKENCRNNNLDCIVHFIKHDGIVWFTILQRNSNNRGTKYRNPVFCAYILGDSYLFFNSIPNVKIVQSLTKALSFISVKVLSLSGRNVKSLHTLLKHQQGQRKPIIAPNYVRQKPRQILGGKDYTQNENRKCFADSCFSVDAGIENLTLEFPDCKWQGLTSIPKCEGMPFPFSLKFVSTNIFSTLKEFHQRNIIDPENCEDYLKNVAKLGKNRLQLTEINDANN